MKQHAQGFTLIELMLVVSCIGILAATAIPAYTDYLRRAKVAEALNLVSGLQKNIADYYAWHGNLPEDNAALELPAPEALQGHYTRSIAVEKGALQITFSDQSISGVLSLRPALLKDDAASQSIIWVCGYATPLAGLDLISENKTTLNPIYLPDVCQSTF